ncbi:SGNH/GDSL hydrolase family protein [Nocardioides lijunqiniae]|uniref:SGNH/GDSL hydrolase family protein n=1 Tax=Nocardioides lijunqiniae TaxID=2760832 RepID=UPI0018777A78|nr:SGNH/GDSL hydrolase family protein [Nocardioides lijunqiniae]
MVLAVIAVGSVSVALLDRPEPVIDTSEPRSFSSDEPEPVAPDLSKARAVVASKKPATISVLGDSTGNDTYEWVYQWAKHLARTRAVAYRAWNDVALKWEPVEQMSTTGPKLTIWNMSAPGRAADYPADKIRKAQPEKPDLIIYNYGHNNSDEDIDLALYTTNEAVKQQWGGPITSTLMLQNPSTTDQADRQEGTVYALRSGVAAWLGFSIIDVHSAFVKAGVPVGQLLIDKTHPNPRGGELWTKVVVRALG